MTKICDLKNLLLKYNLHRFRIKGGNEKLMEQTKIIEMSLKKKKKKQYYLINYRCHFT